MNALDRRRFLGTAAAGLGFLGASACGNNGTASSAGKNLKLGWWGNPDRDKRTKEAIAAFVKKNQGTTVLPQVTVWDSYWDKLATQVAGGNAPDIIQMDYAYITQYAKKGTLLELDSYVPGKLGLGDFDERALRSGKVDGKLYGATWGMNSFALYYNETMLQQLGIEMPDGTMTWSGYHDLAKQVAAKAPDGVYGTTDQTLGINQLECWLRQQGKALYTESGQLGFDATDLEKWFELWTPLQDDDKTMMPADEETALGGALEDNPIVTGKAPFAFMWSNQITALTAATKDTIKIHMFPQSDDAAGKPGQYYKASMLVSVNAKSKSLDSAVQLANALVTDPDVAGKLGFERGVPPSAKLRTTLLPKVSASERLSGEYIETIKSKVGETPPPPPAKAQGVGDAYTFASEQYAFRKASLKQTVDKFFTDAEKALGA